MLCKINLLLKTNHKHYNQKQTQTLDQIQTFQILLIKVISHSIVKIMAVKIVHRQMTLMG